MSWQGIVDGQQACLAVIEDQTVRQGHFGAHRVAAEDHPWIENGELADGPVKLATFDGEVFPALRARQLEPGPDLLPELIGRNHVISDSRKPFRKGVSGQG
jgi:hypothetical protein